MATWIKLYNEALSDPKMGRMSDHLYRRTIEFFLLAGTVDNGGLLPDVEDIAWTLRTTVKDVRDTIEKLSKLGIVTVSGQQYIVTHFAERQMSNLTEAERKAAYRDKQRTKFGQVSGQCPDDVSGQKADTCPDKSPTRVPKMSRLDTDTDIDTEVDTDTELINTAAAAAANAKTQKPKYTPDQPEFWKCAFGPEADRAQSFSQASGIVPVKTEFGRWQKDLRALTEAGIETPVMMRAVTEMRARHLTIKAPGSVMAVARELLVGPRSQKTTEEILAEVELEGLDE